MYEFTMRGAWFRWSELDSVSKKLAAWSIGLSVVGAIPIGLFAGRLGFQIGMCVGTGNYAACGKPDFSLHPALAIMALIACLASGMVWAMFSRRQDEMFNRVQNWAIGVAGAWTGAVTLAWSLLAWGGIVCMLPMWVVGLVYVHLVLLFWFVAVRRWV